MNKTPTTAAQRKLLWQCVALLLIVLTSAGMYLSVTLGLSWLTWLLMAILVVAMFLVIRVA